MSTRIAPVAGLLAGALVAVLAFGAFLALGPDPGATPTPTTRAAALSPSPSAGESPAAPPSAGGSPSPSTDASASPGVVPSGPAGSAGPGAGDLSGAFHVGQPAPALDLPGLGGGRIDLAALRGKPVWVNFMATWCPSCRDELPLMAGYAARYGSQGLTIVAVDVRESADLVRPYMQSLGITFPVALDADARAQQTWGAYALPVHFWIDAGGTVRFGALGGIGPDAMAQGLQSIMPGASISP